MIRRTGALETSCVALQSADEQEVGLEVEPTFEFRDSVKGPRHPKQQLTACVNACPSTTFFEVPSYIFLFSLLECTLKFWGRALQKLYVLYITEVIYSRCRGALHVAKGLMTNSELALFCGADLGRIVTC